MAPPAEGAIPIDDEILIVDSITRLGASPAGRVAIVGSHGGVYVGSVAASAGLRGVIVHDAGIGRDEAGIGALSYLDRFSVAAAAVDGTTATIGDGASLSRGLIGRVNQTALALGCREGQSALACAEAMRRAPGLKGTPPAGHESRFVLSAVAGKPSVIGCDSVALVGAQDLGAIVITGSHGELLKNDPSWGKRPDVLAAVFNDAGSAGATRLPDLDERGIAGATVACASARIGDARSTYEDGVLSHVNQTARTKGASVGQSCRAFVDLMLATM